MKYTRVSAGPDGETHFDEVELAEQPLEIPPAGVVFYRSPPLPAETVRFVRATEAGNLLPPHPAPRRMLVVPLAGVLEVTAGDGAVRRFGPGSALVLDDVGSNGHLTRHATAGDVHVLMVDLVS